MKKKKTAIRNRLLTLMLITTLLTAAFPAAAFGMSASGEESSAGTCSSLEIPASEAGQAVSREYIVTSEGDLQQMRIPGGVENVSLADCHTALLELSDGTDIETVAVDLRRQYGDIQVQPNYIYRSVSVSDPGYSAQWGLYNSLGKDIDFERAYAFVQKYRDEMQETVVAVIDTGFDYSHEDLADVTWTNEGEIPGNKKDDDGNGYVDDVHGFNFITKKAQVEPPYTSTTYDHGTHCAGIIGAVCGNGKGIAGIGSASGKVSMMSLKVLSGTLGEGSTFAVIQAIRYAEQNGADICNLSMGTYQDDSILYSTIASSKMLFVCAAGNDGKNLDSKPIYPGSYSLNNVICVGNMNRDGTLHGTSNYSRSAVDIAAPGTSIYSTVSGNRYKTMSGTSMATPFVTGVAALLHSYYEGITARQIRSLILENASVSSGLSSKVAGGRYLNAYRPLTARTQEAFVPDVTPPVIETTVTKVEGTYKERLTIHAADDSGDEPYVKYARGSHGKAYFRDGGGYDVNLNEESTASRLMGVPGTYTVYAMDPSGNERIVKVTCTADAVKSISLNYTKKTLTRGKTFRLRAVLSKSGTYGRTVTWTSSSKSIASVSSTGKVTAKKKGTVTITAKTGNLLIARCKVTVK